MILTSCEVSVCNAQTSPKRRTRSWSERCHLGQRGSSAKRADKAEKEAIDKSGRATVEHRSQISEEDSFLSWCQSPRTRSLRGMTRLTHVHIIVVVKPNIEMKPKFRLNRCVFPCSAMSRSSCRVRPLTLAASPGRTAADEESALFKKFILYISGMGRKYSHRYREIRIAQEPATDHQTHSEKQ